MASLPLHPLWTCTVAGETAGNSVSYYHIHFFFFSTFLTPHPTAGSLRVKVHSTSTLLAARIIGTNPTFSPDLNILRHYPNSEMDLYLHISSKQERVYSRPERHYEI